MGRDDGQSASQNLPRHGPRVAQKCWGSMDAKNLPGDDGDKSKNEQAEQGEDEQEVEPEDEPEDEQEDEQEDEPEVIDLEGGDLEAEVGDGGHRANKPFRPCAAPYIVGYEPEMRRAYRKTSLLPNCLVEYTCEFVYPCDKPEPHQPMIAVWPDGFRAEIEDIGVADYQALCKDPKFSRGRCSGASSDSIDFDRTTGSIWSSCLADSESKVSVVIRADKKLSDGTRKMLCSLFVENKQKASICMSDYPGNEEEVKLMVVKLGEEFCKGDLTVEGLKQRRDTLMASSVWAKCSRALKRPSASVKPPEPSEQPSEKKTKKTEEAELHSQAEGEGEDKAEGDQRAEATCQQEDEEQPWSSDFEGPDLFTGIGTPSALLSFL